MATLKTEVTLQTTQATAEFNKLSQIVSRFTESVEKKSARSLQGARAEIEALRLETSGHREAAEALRHKIVAQEQSETLAKQTGLSQENAMLLTQRRLELEKQLAAQQARSARLGMGGGRIGLPELPLTTSEMNRTFVATEKTNQSLRGLQKSGRAGGLGFLAVSQAAEDAQYGIKGVLNNIPQAILGFGGTAGLAGALSLAAVAAVTLYKPLRRLSGLMDDEMAEKSAKAWSDAAEKAVASMRNLQSDSDQEKLFSRFAYEVNAALRERIEMQSILLNYHQRQGKEQELEYEFAKRLMLARKDLAEARGDVPAAGDAKQTISELQQQKANRRKILDSAQYDEMDLTGSIGNLAAEATNNAASAAERLLQLRKDLAGATERLAAGEKDLAEAEKNKMGIMDKGLGYLLALTAVGVGGDYSVNKAELLEKQNIKNLEDNKTLYEASKKKIEDEITSLEKSSSINKEAMESARAAANEKLESLRQTSQAAFEEIQQLEKRIQLEEELAGIEQARRDAVTNRSKKNFRQEMEILKAQLDGDQAKLDAIDRQRRIEEEILRLKKEQSSITEKEATAKATEKANAQDALRDKERDKEKKGQRATELGYRQELDVLRLRASGRAKAAEALEKEFRTRAEGVKLAQEAGISEEAALRLVRERQQLETAIASQKDDNKSRRPRRAIFKKDGEDTRLLPSGGAVGLQGARGLSNRPGLSGTAVEAARNSRPGAQEAEARKAAIQYYQKNINQNEEILAIWRNIGVA